MKEKSKREKKNGRERKEEENIGKRGGKRIIGDIRAREPVRHTK